MSRIPLRTAARNRVLPRRVFLRNALLTSALVSSTLTSGLLPTVGLAADVPVPTHPEGRLTPLDLSVYDENKLSGGPPKDGIPSIDEPRFTSAGEGDLFMNDSDIVFGIVVDGIARAYPRNILVWHEIVNDTIAGRGFAVTYCPLTGTAVAFKRGETEFGVSGRLVNSNLIMYDRDTDTWFPQVLAVGISGPHKGTALVEYPLVWTTWERWRDAHPDTEVLSFRTGFARNYHRDPYGSYNPRGGYYYPDSGPMFPVLNRDDRFLGKEDFIGARTTDNAVAFRLDSLREAGRLSLDVNGQTFTAVHDDVYDSGVIHRGELGSGEALVTMHAMWFAWIAFYPESAVHG